MDARRGAEKKEINYLVVDYEEIKKSIAMYGVSGIQLDTRLAQLFYTKESLYRVCVEAFDPGNFDRYSSRCKFNIAEFPYIVRSSMHQAELGGNGTTRNMHIIDLFGVIQVSLENAQKRKEAKRDIAALQKDSSQFNPDLI